MANEYLVILSPFANDLVEVRDITNGGNGTSVPANPAGQWKIEVPFSDAGGAFRSLLVNVGRDANAVAARRQGRVDLHLLGDGDTPDSSNLVLVLSTRTGDTGSTPPPNSRPDRFRTSLAFARPWKRRDSLEAPNATGSRTVRTVKSRVGNTDAVTGALYLRGLLEIAFRVG